MGMHRNPVPRNSAKTARAASRECLREQNDAFLADDTRRPIPFFDSDRHELRVGTIVVKHFTQRSDAQEIILASFQEENWCQSIDDPLTCKPAE